MGGSIHTRVFHHNVHHHYHNQQGPEPEGKITVNPKIKNKPGGNTGKIGEYVDYEELN
jgi:hypothetical protein